MINQILYGSDDQVGHNIGNISNLGNMMNAVDVGQDLPSGQIPFMMIRVEVHISEKKIEVKKKFEIWINSNVKSYPSLALFNLTLTKSTGTSHSWTSGGSGLFEITLSWRLEGKEQIVIMKRERSQKHLPVSIDHSGAFSLIVEVNKNLFEQRLKLVIVLLIVQESIFLL